MSKSKPCGLLQFFHQNSRDQYDEQVRRHTAEENEATQQRQERTDAEKECQAQKSKETDRERQRKHWQKTYDAEIAKGERSPGGTKQKRKVRVLVSEQLK